MTTVAESNDSSPSIFHSVDFRLLLLGRMASTGASATTWILLPLYVYQATGSAAASGLMSAMNVVPFILFGLFAGVMVDRLPPRSVMVLVEVLNALVMLLVPLAVFTIGLPFWAALSIGFLTSTAFVWFDVASSALVPEIAGPGRVFQANGNLWTATTIVNAFAAPLGYLLLDKLGIGLTFVVLGLIYAVSAGITFLVKTGRGRGVDAATAGKIGRSELLEGLRFIRADHVVGVLTLVGIGIGISGGAVYTMVVVFADTTLGLATDDTRVAIIIASGGVGAIVAAILTPRLRHRNPVKVSLVILTLDVFLMLAYAWSPTWLIAAFLIGAWNIVHTIAMIISISVRQQRCPPHLQGRVNAVGRMLAWGAVPLGGGICGLIVDRTDDASIAITLMVIPVALSVCLLIFMRPTALRPPESSTK